MDNDKHNDWTGAVRDRLEGRELAPSDALWERIGAAVPQAGAPRKVRRLAWGGAFGVAAAAALAAVLFLRPAGTKEDGRIEVVPTGAAPLAEQRALTDTESPVTMAEETSVTPVTNAKISLAQYPAAGTKSQVATAEVANVAREEAPAAMAEAPVAIAETPVLTETAAVTGARQTEEDNSMSLEDFLAQEEKERRPRRLTASIYAAGRPSAGIIINNDFFADMVSIGNKNSTSPGNVMQHDPGQSATSSIPPYGYYTDPENTNLDNYLSYADDPYNLSGERLNHSKPISIGIAVTYPLHDHLFLESGMYYSYLHSSSYRTDQTLHSIGIPLKVGYRFGSARRTSLALSAGAKAEKCLLALKGGEKLKEPGIQLAAVGSAAIQYDFSPRLGLFIAPEVSYWFTGTKLPTYNTEHPFNLSLKAGIALSLGD
ncbi:MAG: hypothetical protein IKR72_01810 [Bacteroidales bacterium]|nr:hypothetical protein [Bacteroidales bacterium]